MYKLNTIVFLTVLACILIGACGGRHSAIRG